MPKYTKPINNVFQALADPTRRAVIDQLSNAPATVTELAAPHAMALPSFVQHLKVLEDCGLIRSVKVGRVRTCHLVPDALSTAEDWIANRRRHLNEHLDALETYLNQNEGRDS